MFPTLYDDIATRVSKDHIDAANRLLQEHYHVTYEQPSATCYNIGDLGNRDRHAQYVGVSNLAHKLGLLSVMEYDEENYLTINVYGEKDNIEEFKRRLSHECYVQRLAYRLTKAPKDEWSDPRQDYIVGYFNGMAADKPNTPDLGDGHATFQAGRDTYIIANNSLYLAQTHNLNESHWDRHPNELHETFYMGNYPG